MGAFDKTQAEIKRFREEVLEAAKGRSKEVVDELVKSAVIQVLGGLLGASQTADGRVLRTKGTPVAQPLKWKRPVKGYVGGRLRGNWQVQVGNPALSPLLTKDADGNATYRRELAKIDTKIPDFPVVYLTNNLPYAAAVEAGPLAAGSPYEPGFFFKAVQLTREALRDTLREDRDLLDEGNR